MLGDQLHPTDAEHVGKTAKLKHSHWMRVCSKKLHVET